MTETTVVERAGIRAADEAPRAGRVRRWWSNPWRRPRLLGAVTWGYLAWSILPLFVAILISFNQGRSNSSIQGIGLNWWWGDPESSLFRDPVPSLPTPGR